VTEQMDLYLEVVVSLMFLAGVSLLQYVYVNDLRSENACRARLRLSLVCPQKASHDEPEWKSRTNP
jgi:hypothetical protein